MKEKFSKLALGTKFQYGYADKKVFVKIGSDLIAEWDESKKTDVWIGQGIYSFSEDNNLEREVVVL